MAPKRRVSHSLHVLQEAAAQLENREAKLRTEQRDCRNALRRHMYQEQLPAGATLSAKILLCRQAGDEAGVRAFLSAKTQRSVDAIDRHVADLLAWYSTTSEAERVQVAEPSAAPAAARAGAVVDKYLQENNLHAWVTTQNLVKGITPTTPVVLQHLAGAVPPAAPAVGGRASRRRRRSSLQFLRRWRRRWGVRLGLIGKLDHVLEQEMQDKAPRMGDEKCKHGCLVRCPGPRQTEQSGAAWRHHFLARL